MFQICGIICLALLLSVMADETVKLRTFVVNLEDYARQNEQQVQIIAEYENTTEALRTAVETLTETVQTQNEILEENRKKMTEMNETIEEYKRKMEEMNQTAQQHLIEIENLNRTTEVLNERLGECQCWFVDLSFRKIKEILWESVFFSEPIAFHAGQTVYPEIQQYQNIIFNSVQINEGNG